MLFRPDFMQSRNPVPPVLRRKSILLPPHRAGLAVRGEATRTIGTGVAGAA